jgi:hypothetical protein
MVALVGKGEEVELLLVLNLESGQRHAPDKTLVHNMKNADSLRSIAFTGNHVAKMNI